MKAFGCLCFSCLRPYNSYKLNFRSSPYIFLEYATNQKGYKHLDNHGKTVVLRHVVFIEQVYLFTQVTIKPTEKMYNPRASIPIIPLHQDKVIDSQA